MSSFGLRGELGVALMACAVFSLVGSSAPQEFHRETLVVAIPGIKDSASNDLIGVGASISPTTERFVILEGGETLDRLPEGFALRPTPSLVKKDNIIRIDDPRSPRSIELLRRIAQTPNATVIVDMNIGLRVGETAWTPHTKWAAEVVTKLGESHLASHPNSHMALVGHSHGTEPMALVPGQLFRGRRYALSPRTADGHPPGTNFVVADGDFFYNPRGRVTADAVFKTMGPSQAEQLAAAGHNVIRLAGDGTPSPGFAPRKGAVSYLAAYTAEYLAREAAVYTASTVNRFDAHTSVTAVNEPGQRIVVYPTGGGSPVELPGTSIANTIRLLDQSQSATAGRRAALDTTQLTQLATAVRQSEPTPGLGGISLNATAQIAIDPQSVRGARYDSKQQRLHLLLKDGKTLRFPSIDPTVLQQAFYFGYVTATKPELSIGGTQFVTPDKKEVTNLPPPGKHPVYYLGGTEGTNLGLAMFLADEALGQLAFTDDVVVRGVATHVAGFRSLPQLYPEKYSMHPGARRHLGEQRVFLTPSVIEYVLAPGGDALEFGRTMFSAQFAYPGPAEMAFAAFLESRFAEVAATNEGAPLRQLIHYARAHALFRWLRENRISLEPETLSGTRGRTVLTPSYTAPFPTPLIAQVTRPYPTVLFGAFGPRQLVDRRGDASTITYKDGLAVGVRRADGSTLEVLRDNLGHPVALRMNGALASVFRLDASLGLVFVDNVRLQGAWPKISFAMTERTRIYPESRPEDTVQRIVVGFLNQEARR